MVPLFVMMILPFLNGSFDSANLTNKLGDSGLAWGGLQLALVWLWLMCWSAWGVDVCATFAPEYKDTVRDTKLALRSAALFSMVVYIVLPIGLVGGAGPKLVEGYDYPGAMDKIVGSTRFTDFFVVCLIASFIITMNTATADGGRALYGISRDGMTVKQLGTLNRFRGAGECDDASTWSSTSSSASSSATSSASSRRATSATCSRTCSRSRASCCSARTGRTGRDRSSCGGSGRRSPGLLAVWCLILTIVGFGWFDTAGGGYGGTKEKVIGVGVLVIGLLLFFFRRLVQDKERIHWREDTPTMPPDGRLVRRPDPLILRSGGEGGGLARPLRLPFASPAVPLKNGRTRTAPEEASRHGA